MKFPAMIIMALMVAGVSFADSPKDVPQSKSIPKDVKIQGKTFVGKPVVIDDILNIIVVQNEKRKEMEFYVPVTAQILKDGHSIQLCEINKKIDVTVTYVKKRGKLFALKIEQLIINK
jgi:hypothetical protein